MEELEKEPTHACRARLSSGQPWRRPATRPVTPQPARAPTPRYGAPLTESARPPSQNKAQEELRQRVPAGSLRDPPALLGTRRFPHLCAPRGRSPPAPVEIPSRSRVRSGPASRPACALPLAGGTGGLGTFSQCEEEGPGRGGA